MYNKNYSKILKLIIYVYIFIMIFISFLLMFNNIINIIFYSYYKYNNKFIVNDEEKLYVYETYTYKLFISMLKDNLENYNNLYFTLNTSSNLLKIFIIFTIVFFWLLIISDIYLIILEIIENNYDIANRFKYLIVLFIVIVISIYYSLLFIINYIDLLIVSVSLWIVVFVVACVVLMIPKTPNSSLISIVFLFSTFFVPDDSSEDESSKDDSDGDESSEDKKFKKFFYYTILIFVFIIFVLLILSFTIFEGKNATTISYEKYCFDICNDKKYNSLENYFHNEYFKDMDYKYLEEIKLKLEEHNIYTIDKIINFKLELEKDNYNNNYINLDNFIEQIIKISKILKSSEYDYDKYDKLDFVKLVNIFINNELIYMNRYYGKRHVNENDLHKDFNYLFNMNEKIVNKETYNIENVLIAAFPVKYINENNKITDNK
jgi:hypothetical protein